MNKKMNKITLSTLFVLIVVAASSCGEKKQGELYNAANNLVDSVDVSAKLNVIIDCCIKSVERGWDDTFDIRNIDKTLVNCGFRKKERMHIFEDKIYENSSFGNYYRPVTVVEEDIYYVINAKITGNKRIYKEKWENNITSLSDDFIVVAIAMCNNNPPVSNYLCDSAKDVIIEILYHNSYNVEVKKLLEGLSYHHSINSRFDFTASDYVMRNSFELWDIDYTIETEAMPYIAFAKDGKNIRLIIRRNGNG